MVCCYSGIKRNNVNHSGKSNYEHESVQHNTPFKKRKLFGQTSVVTHDGGISSESVSNLTVKGVHNWSGSVTKHHEGFSIFLINNQFPFSNHTKVWLPDCNM